MREVRGARCIRLPVIVLALALTAHPRSLLAQQVFGIVRDSASQLPLPNTVVLVLDPSGRLAARSTTDQLGRFRLAPTVGKSAGRSPVRSIDKLHLRILRMGFRPHEISLAGAATRSALDISLVSFPVMLEELHVTSAPSCPKRPDRAAALELLQQVRTALFATVLARSRNSATMTRLLYQRRLDGASGRILSQSVRTRITSATSEPFSAARSASAFVREGFREDSTGFHAYVGPDAETLVDDAFAESYCFRLMAPDRGRPRQVGLGFEPATRDDTGHIDIVGTLWVDTLSRVLRDLTFRYVGLDRETSALNPEGRLSFRELANGVVLIDQWSIRLNGEGGGAGSPTPGSEADGMSTGASRSHAQEIGGEIARAAWPDGYSWKPPLATIRLHAVDRQGRPAVASVVQLVDTDYQTTTDSTGFLLLTDLLPGPYTATIRDPRLAALEVPSASSTRLSAVRDSTIDARLEVETAEGFASKRCGRDSRPTGDAWVLGRVITPDGRPVKDARWSIRDEFGTALVEGGRVDDDGVFHWCQLHANARIAIEVWRDDRRVNENRVVTDRLTTLRFVMPP
ncbi:MAG: hypothetical protein JWL95_2984 [Gemmatimonadetes bacterium]|nr:hypothetical protein [Gemmatimonadota bacterium]